MKLVLLKDVKNMGRSGAVVEVSDGYAVNFLIPRKLAVLATASAQAQAKTIENQHAQTKEMHVKMISERLQSLAEGTVTILKKINEKGHLYDAVDAQEIADATALPVEVISLEKPIKEAGVYRVPVSYHGNFGTVSITVSGE
jgi:large subunit ribosomal protein L9